MIAILINWALLGVKEFQDELRKIGKQAGTELGQAQLKLELELSFT